MGKIKFKKPDIKGCFGKLKSLKWADVKNGIRAMKKRQAEKEAAYRNSRFAQKMQKLYPYMNRYSLILHGIWAIAINFLIEAMSRHSVVAAISYSRVSTKAFLYNAFMIFVTFSIVYLCKRRVFARFILSFLWLLLGLTNGLMLSRRVTPFNAQDLKTVAEGVSLFTNYFNVLELVGIAIILILLGVITLRIPAAYLITFAVFMLIFGKEPMNANYLVAELCGGGLMLGAFFMATDYVTSPITPAGQIIYGICCGLLTGIFRCFGANAEGVSFAIILSNILVPIIEKFTIPRAFGLAKEAKKNE